MASSSADVVIRVRQDVEAVFQRLQLLGPYTYLVAGVSGGPDSLCLLDALVTLMPFARTNLTVGHVDHRLRLGSAGDAEHVRAVAEQYGVGFQSFNIDVPGIAVTRRCGIEEAARFARYPALASASRSPGQAIVVTGHTRDDDVETVVLHLLRGSGMRGLAGMSESEQLPISGEQSGRWGHPRRDVRIVRPLLRVSRAETTAYCEARGIRYLTDETNTDPRFLRNRVRGHLLPVLRTYNPAIDDGILRLSRLVRDEESWLDLEAKRRLRRLSRADAAVGQIPESVHLDLAAWGRQQVVMQRRMVRVAAERLHYREIGFDAVERALAVGTPDGPPRADLGGSLGVERRTDTLVFSRYTPGRNAPENSTHGTTPDDI